MKKRDRLEVIGKTAFTFTISFPFKHENLGQNTFGRESKEWANSQKKKTKKKEWAN